MNTCAYCDEPAQYKTGFRTLGQPMLVCLQHLLSRDDVWFQKLEG